MVYSACVVDGAEVEPMETLVETGKSLNVTCTVRGMPVHRDETGELMNE